MQLNYNPTTIQLVKLQSNCSLTASARLQSDYCHNAAKLHLLKVNQVHL